MAAKSKKTVKAPVIDKSNADDAPIRLSIDAALGGELVNEVRDKTIEFIHNGKLYAVDVYLKTLPFNVTEPLYKRWGKDDPDVVEEWVALALVDENGKNLATKQQVGSKFVQPMVRAIFDELWGAENVKKQMEMTNKDE